MNTLTKGGLFLLLSFALSLGVAAAPLSEPQLLRVPYHSAKLNAERDYFVYLPRGFRQQAHWPVLVFLHGNGERGDGKADLDFVLIHGPLMEAWCQQRDLPFVIIAPQLPMYDQGEVDYIKNRKRSDIPQRRAEGINPYPWHARSKLPMDGQLAAPVPEDLTNYGNHTNGWNTMEAEILAMIDHVVATCKGDPRQVYLTGISQGGKGTWHLAARHPERFAAIAPIVGSGAPELAAPLTAGRVPIWVFAGGRDASDNKVKYFYPLLNELEKLGHPEVRFTIEADLGHDAWIRIYAGQDLYTWLLSHVK